MSAAAALVDLLEILRAERFRIGIDEHVKVHDLLLLLAARGKLHPDGATFDQLVAWLLPLLCKSPEEIERFPGLLLRWWEVHGSDWSVAWNDAGEPSTDTPPIPPAGSDPPAPSVATTTAPERPTWHAALQRVPAWLLLVALVPLLVVIFLDRSAPQPTIEPIASKLIVVKPSDEKPQPTSRQSEEPTPAPPPQASPAEQPPGLRPALVVGVLAALALLAGSIYLPPLLNRRRFDSLARNKQDLPVAVDRPKLADWLRKNVMELKRSQAAVLARYRPGERMLIDLAATVGATVRNGGVLTLRERARHERPGYLMLMEQSHPDDQQLRWFMHWHDEFAGQGLALETYVYSGDPRVCWRPEFLSRSAAEEAAPTTTSLHQLADRHVGDRLLVFGDGASLYDPVAGKLASWVADGEFAAWRERILLTPVDPREWGRREEMISEAGFALLPATAAGLVALVEWIANGQAQLVVRGFRTRLPRLLGSLAWIDSEAPASIDSVDELIEALRSYLGDDAFRWLAASAVFPLLRWELVVELGRTLLEGDSAPTAAQLQRLTRLPWLRRGSIPDWLRLRLLNELSVEEQREARKAAEELLARELDAEFNGKLDAESAAALPTLPVALHGKTGGDRDDAGEDFIALGFLGGLSAQQLALRAPARWRKAIAGGAETGASRLRALIEAIVYRQGIAAAGVKQAVAGALLALVVVSGSTLALLTHAEVAAALPDSLRFVFYPQEEAKPVLLAGNSAQEAAPPTADPPAEQPAASEAPPPADRAKPEPTAVASSAKGAVTVEVSTQPAKPVAPETSVPPDTALPMGTVFKDCADCPELVVLPAGSFRMGSPDSEKDRSGHEGPVHEVQIGYVLAVGRSEVSRGEFSRFVTATGYRTEAERGDGCYATEQGTLSKVADRNWRNPGFAQTDNHPVVCVSWNDTQAYLEWLNKRVPGKNYRLLSEAEWEYAARAGQGGKRFPWGDDVNYSEMCAYANGADRTAKEQVPGASNWAWTIDDCSDSFAYTAPGDALRANAFGLHHMHGNALEWVQDVWQDNYQGAPNDGSAWMTNGTDARRVLRGGSWGGNPWYLRSANRGRYSPDIRGNYAGFRIARTF